MDEFANESKFKNIADRDVFSWIEVSRFFPVNH